MATSILKSLLKLTLTFDNFLCMAARYQLLHMSTTISVSPPKFQETLIGNGYMLSENSEALFHHHFRSDAAMTQRLKVLDHL